LRLPDQRVGASVGYPCVVIQDLSVSAGRPRIDDGTIDAQQPPAPTPVRPSRVPSRYRSAALSPLQVELRPGHQVIELCRAARDEGIAGGGTDNAEGTCVFEMMAHKIRICVVVENTAQGVGLLGEHGLAYWIEGEGQRVLLDTGQGTVLASNAFKLDVPLHEADAVILSHGHYDHSGALADVLRVNRPYVFVHPAALDRKFARNQDGASREIGIPASGERALRERSGSLVATTSPTPVFGRLCVTGPVPRVTDFEDTGGPFFLDSACSRPDPLAGDQAVFFETRDGVVVLLGCAHSGVVNTLQYVDQLTGPSSLGHHSSWSPRAATWGTCCTS